jgi:two-component system, NarL family, nitrate/nitrite response regulator NarL
VLQVAGDEAYQAVLTATQRTVLELSATGAGVAEVASALGLSEDEVGEHLRSITITLGASSKLEAVIVALRRGLISLS